MDATRTPNIHQPLTRPRDEHEDDRHKEHQLLADAQPIADRRQHHARRNVRNGGHRQAERHVHLLEAQAGKEERYDHLEVHLGHVEQRQPQQQHEKVAVAQQTDVQQRDAAPPERRLGLDGRRAHHDAQVGGAAALRCAEQRAAQQQLGVGQRVVAAVRRHRRHRHGDRVHASDRVVLLFRLIVADLLLAMA